MNIFNLKEVGKKHKIMLDKIKTVTLPSLLILSGMWWTVCSFIQELVNICSSMDVRETVLKP